jgi:hypothetical protein
LEKATDKIRAYKWAVRRVPIEPVIGKSTCFSALLGVIENTIRDYLKAFAVKFIDDLQQNIQFTAGILSGKIAIFDGKNKNGSHPQLNPSPGQAVHGISSIALTPRFLSQLSFSESTSAHRRRLSAVLRGKIIEHYLVDDQFVKGNSGGIQFLNFDRLVRGGIIDYKTAIIVRPAAIVTRTWVSHNANCAVIEFHPQLVFVKIRV